MRIRYVLLACLVGLGLVACGGGGGNGANCTTPSSGSTMTGAESALGAQVLTLVNQERSDRGLSTLNGHGSLAQVAYEHSWDMVTRGFFAHTNPCGEGPADRVNRAGISWTGLGENIAHGQETAGAVMASWMSSLDHRANILNPDFTHCVIGVYQAPGDTHWTMVLIEQ